MPFTYSGGGGPIGNRYFLGFYPLLLFLTPPLRTAAVPIAALAIGALFTAQLVLNPFYTSFHPAEHAKAGPLRVAAGRAVAAERSAGRRRRERSRRRSAARRRFPRTSSTTTRTAGGGWFWVRGESRADVLLRAPAVVTDGAQPVSLRVRRLSLEVINGMAPNHVVISAGFRRVALDLAPGEVRAVDFKPAGGVPYKPALYPTNYIYSFSVSTSAGFVPFLEEAGQHRQPLSRRQGSCRASLLAGVRSLFSNRPSPVWCNWKIEI